VTAQSTGQGIDFGRVQGQFGRCHRVNAAAPRVDRTPPRLDAVDVCRLDRLAQARHHERNAARGAERQQRLGRLVPGMHGQAEGAPVHRQEGTAAEQRPGLDRVRRPEVDVPPGRMEGADLEHHEVEGTEALADVGVLRRETGVAAEEDMVARRADRHRRPQRRVAVLQPAAGEVLRRRGGHHELGAGQRVRFPPVELGDAFRRHAEGFEVRADAERGDEGHVAVPGQRADGRIVEVVVVVVRDDDEVDGRQRVQAHRHGLKALRPGHPRRRGARAPHRIGEHAQAVDLDEHGGVAEPRGAQPRVRRLAPDVGRVEGRQRRARHAPPVAAQEIAHARPRRACVAQPGQHGVHVAERIALPERGGLHAFEAQAFGLSSQ
jgi:hypothetical protein